MSPFADASTYAHFLFNAFDTDHNGSVSFEVRWVTEFLFFFFKRSLFGECELHQTFDLQPCKWLNLAVEHNAAWESCVDFNSSRDGTNRRLIFMRGIYFLIGTDELSSCQTMKLCWLILKSIQLKSPEIPNSQKRSQANTSNLSYIYLFMHFRALLICLSLKADVVFFKQVLTHEISGNTEYIYMT